MITVGFAGLGLIGGSIAKALKKAHSDIKILAYNRSAASLTKAVKDGVVDVALDAVDERFSECDIIFLCTPVEHNLTYLELLKKIIKPGAIITDVGSVKGYIHKTVSELGMDDCFIGGHPMAGSEKTGYDAAFDSLLENAYYVITPTKSTSQKALDFYVSLVKSTKAIPIITQPDIHDYAVAGISHVPHLIASGLVNVVRENDTPDELMRTLAAGGFKDITRIASSSAAMWSQICMTNPVQISDILDKYINYLKDVKKYVDTHNKDAISKMFIESKEYRDSINIGPKGPISEQYTVFCHIEDKKGALSDITTLLSLNGISIKNIEIIHNREYVKGALLVEFYDKASYEEAIRVLLVNNYSIYR